MSFKPKDNWSNKRRINPKMPVPYGYKVDEDSSKTFIPDYKSIQYIEEAFDALDAGTSLRATASWLAEQTGRTLSHQTMANLWKRHRDVHVGTAMVDKVSKRKKLKASRTRKEKKEARLIQKISSARRSKIAADKRVAKFSEVLDVSQNKVETKSELDFSVTKQDKINEKEIVFRPNPGPQTEFLAASEKEVLYGGSAGGGKTYSLLADPMRYFNNKNFSGLILRRTNDELRDLKWKSQELYPIAFPGAKWKEKDSLWVFPSGAKLWLTYLERDDDVLRYQGQAFSYIAFDELTQYATSFAWEYMRSRLRTIDSDLPTFMRATSNPGGVGHCVTHGDVLTPDNGWVDIKTVKVGDAIYTVDENKNLVETVVNQVHKHHIDEDIYKVTTRNLRMSVTSNHKVAKVGGAIDNKNAKYTLVPFSDLPGQADILRTVEYTGNSLGDVRIDEVKTRKRRLNQPNILDPILYMKLVGWYISEGCRVHRDKAISISQCKSHTRKIIEELLCDLGYTYSKSSQGFTIYCPDLYAHMERYGDYCVNKCIPTYIKNANKEELQALLDAARLGDGCGNVYYTSSKKLSDDIEEIAIKLGYIIYTSGRQRENRKTYSYQVNMTKNKVGGTQLLTGNHIYNVDTHVKQKSNIIKAHHSGYVYCLGIDNTHTFLIKQDGAVWVSGNSWVKKMFVDPAPYNTPFDARDMDTGEILRWTSDKPELGIKKGDPLFQRRFIPAKLSDNPYLYADGQYESNLLSLPEAQRRRLLDGDWSVTDGAAFPEFSVNDHVIKPFEIPDTWRRFRSCDYGFRAPSAVHWYAIDPSYETLIVYRELYVSGKTGTMLANLILELEMNENISYGMLDSSVWHQRGQTGPSIAEEMQMLGCKWRAADRSSGSRTNGKNRLHEVLQIDKEIPHMMIDGQMGRPGIVFFDTCRQIIADLPVIPIDPKGKEDIDARYATDHTYDSIRYGIMSRPRAFSPFDFGDKRMVTDIYRPSDSVFGY